MFSLTITDAAYAQIQNELSRSTIASPVVNLVQSSQSFSAPDGLMQAIATGASESALHEISLGQVRSEHEALRWSLIPAVYPRDEIPADCLIEIRGIWFSFSLGWRSVANGWLLDAAGDGLVLKDAVGNVVLPDNPDLGVLDGA